MKHLVAFISKAYRTKNMAFALFILAVCLFVFPMSVMADCTKLVNGATGTIDLGGSVCELASAITINGNATITNGTIKSAADDVLTVNGGALRLGSNLTVECTSSVIWAKNNATVIIDGAKITGKSGGANAYPTVYAEKSSKITINSGTLTSEVSSTLSADTNSTITINGGTVSNTVQSPAYCTAYSKHGGSIILNDGEINSQYGSGLVATGNSFVELNGGTVTSASNMYAVVAHEGNAKAVISGGIAIGAVGAGTSNKGDNNTLTITGGTINGKVYQEKGTVSITGGTFSPKPDESYIDEYSVAVQNEDGTWSVKIAVYVKPDADQTKIYDNNPENPGSYSYKLYNAKGGDNTGKFNISGALSRESGEDAGTYEYELGTLALANQHVEAGYQLFLAPDDGVVFTIEPRPVTLKIDDRVPYTGTPQLPTATYVDIDGEIKNVTFSFDEGQENINVGKYKAWISIEDKNYISNKLYQFYYIVPAELKLEWNTEKTEFPYNGEKQHPEFTLTGCVGDDEDSEGVCKDEFIQKNFTVSNKIAAGVNYPAEASLNADVTNYTLTIANSVNYTITQKEIELDWDDDVVDEEDGYVMLVYNGDSQTLGASILGDGIVDGDTCTLKIAGTRRDVQNGPKTAVASLEGEDCGNYRITNPTRIFKITPKELTLDYIYDPVEEPLVYNGEEQHPDFTLTGCVGDDAEDSEGTCTYDFIQENITTFGSFGAGIHTTNAHLHDGQKNYTLSEKGIAYNIYPKPITVIWEGNEFEYNGKIQRPVPSIKEGGLAEDDVELCEIVAKGGEKYVREEAYTARAQWSIASDKSCKQNYTLEESTHEYRITPLEAEIGWSGNSFTYNGEPQMPQASVDNLFEDDDCEVTVTVEGEHVNVREGYVATATALSNPNYKLSEEGDFITFEITQREAQLVWSSEDSFTYIKDTAQAPTARYKALNDELIDAAISITDTDGNLLEKAVNAGDYKAIASIADPNYTFANIDDAEKDFTINKAKVTVVPTDVSRPFGGYDPQPFNYQIMNAKGTTDVRGNIEQEGSYLTRDYSIPEKAGGSYKFIIDNIKLKAQYDKNYELVLGEPKYYQITDGEIKPIVFPQPKDDLTYDGTAQELFIAGSAEHGTIMYSADGADWSPDMPKQTNAGDYTYYYFVKGDENYADRYGAEGNPFEIVGKILPKPLTVTPDSGQSKVYGEADPEKFTYTVSRNVEGETPVFTGALKRAAGEDVDTYFIRKGNLKLDENADVNKNYVYDPATGFTQRVLFTITPRTAVIGWNQTTVSFEYDGSEHVPTAVINNLKEGDECDVSVDGAQKNVGEHFAVAVELSNKNYVLPEDENQKTTEFVITPAKVTVTANDINITYGQDIPELTATVDGLKGEDTEDLIEYTLTLDKGDKNVGEYAITPVGEENQGNYEVTFVPGTLTIGQASVIVEVTGRDVTAVYDGEQHSTVYDMKVISDQSGKYDLNDVKFVGTAWRVDKVDVGEYELILSKDDFKNNNKNYNVTFQVSSGMLTITKAPVTVTVTGRNVIADYDGEVHSTVYDMAVTSDKTGKYDLDDVKFVGSAWRVDKTDAGIYDLTLSESDFDNTNKNFDVTFLVESGKLTINQAKVTVTADDQTKVYGAADPDLTATVEGLKGADTKDVITYTVTRDEGDDVGEYVITPSGEVSQGNYKVTYKPGTLTIGQAKVTVKVTGRNVEAVYDGKVHTTVYDMAVTSDESGKYNLDDVRITGAAWRIDQTDAGEYELKLMPSNFSNINENFNVEFETENGNLTIKPLLAVIEWSDLQKFYNGQAQYPTAKVMNKIGEDICDVTVETKDGETPVSAGTYTAVAVRLSNTNYILDPVALPSTVYQISAKLAEVEWSEPEKVYNGEAQLPTATVKPSDLITGDTCTVVVEIEGGKAVDAGEYTAKASSFKEEMCQQNYSLSGENLTTDFTITPKTVDLTWTPETDPILFSYDGQPHRPEASYTNVKNETVVVKDEEITITPGGQAVNFGKYTATAESADTNYVFSEGTASKVFQIVAKVIVIVPDPNQNMVFGTSDDELNLTYTLQDKGGNPVSEPELVGKLGHDGYTVGGWPYNMGTLDLKPEDKGNYTLTLDSTAQFAINPKPVHVTWDNTELTYSGNPQAPVVYVPDAELVTLDGTRIECGVTLTEGSYNTDAGKGYTAEVEKLENGNYELASDAVKTMTYNIAKAKLEPGEDKDFTAPEGKVNLTYTGQAQDLITGGTGKCVDENYCTFQYEVTDFESGMITKDVSMSGTIPQGADTGTYTIAWMVKSNNPNIEDYIPDEPITVRIAPTELNKNNIVITPQTSFVYDHTQKSVEFTVVGSDGRTPLTKDVDYTVVKAETSAFAVGTYEIVINGLGGYTGTNVRKTWEIIDNETIKPFEFYRLNGFWDRETNCPTFGCGQQLPATGFPTRFRMPLSVRPDGLKYQDLGMRLQIPALAVNVDLVGVPKLGTDWAIEWLGADAGILSGTSEPGRGYTMIAGHNHLNESEIGPFLNLGSLKQYDTIYISLENGMNLPFSVYANELMRPDDYEAIAKIAAEDPHSIVLVTCENETAAGGYMNRRVVFAKPF